VPFTEQDVVPTRGKQHGSEAPGTYTAIDWFLQVTLSAEYYADACEKHRAAAKVLHSVTAHSVTASWGEDSSRVLEMPLLGHGI
jgi:hypothetical protein